MTANEFVRMVAAMKSDGEDDGDGSVYEQSIDDAYETIASLITKAREIVKAQPEDAAQWRKAAGASAKTACATRRMTDGNTPG